MRSLGQLLLAGFCGLLGVLASGRGSPAGETEDWIKDLLALRAASCPATRTGARCVTSPVVKGGNPAERLELDVTGLDELWLTAQGVPNYNHARTAWCEPELVKPDGKIVRLTELKPFRAEVGWGQLMLNLDHTNAPLKVKDRAFVYGFWAHADSVLAFKLDRQFVAFRCWIGLTGGPGGAARFAAGSAPPAKAVAGQANAEFAKRHPDRQRVSARLLEAWAAKVGTDTILDGQNGICPHFRGTQACVTAYAQSLKKAAPRFQERIERLRGTGAPEEDWLRLAAEIAATEEATDRILQRLLLVDPAALRRAIEDLKATFPDTYPGDKLLARLGALSADLSAIRAGVRDCDAAALAAGEAWLALQTEALLANPLLDFDRLLLVRRAADRLGLPQNWQSNCVLPRAGYDNDIAVLSAVSPAGTLFTLYKPADDAFVGDLRLHPDAGRLMFSKSNPQKPWQVHEIQADGTGLRQVTPEMGNDVNNYDACYLPNGDILFTSTATMVAVPCVNGSTHVANIFRMSADGKQVRQLCFDQEHNWCPTLLNNGRVLYLRWEYADLPHSNSRRLFHMNPDGTAQMEYYGSNSYWPNGTFYARPIPGYPTQVIGIVSGHHGVPRMGELVLFDPAQGRFEAEGALQRIPGFGKKVERVVKDNLVDGSWPKFLHPFPLGGEDGRGSGKYFLVSCKPTPDSLWGLYLVDVFDNLLLLKEQPRYALLEPVPLRKTPMPPAIPDRVDLKRKDSLVYLSDIYEGPGLKGIPRGEVKALRVFTYVYGYRDMGGLYGTIGMDGPWDVHRILGNVPVESDGSAFFRIPANTPVAVQPLDKEGKALQLMRSWFVGMPGEVISCAGCHEPQNSSPAARQTIASRKTPTDLEAWYGQTRGFSFAREVQPVLDAKCVTCHNGTTKYQGRPLMSLRGDQPLQGWKSEMSGHQDGRLGGKFSVAYANLHRFVRHPGIESDMHLLVPMDFHADTTELAQILRKGHHDVTLTAEEWERFAAWMDMNTPFHGDWATITGGQAVQREKRRAELRKTYAGVDDYQIDPPPPASHPPEPAPDIAAPPAPPETASAPGNSGTDKTSCLSPNFQARPVQALDLGDGVRITLAYVPPGEFLLGSETGAADERPTTKVAVRRGFWMATTEMTNEQFARFDPRHDSRREHKQGYQFGVEGYPLFQPQQPVVRVSWRQAVAFSEWLAARTGLKAALPTEAQWEYACRAGAATPFSYGGLDADFSKHANMADLKTRELASNPYTPGEPIPNPPEFDDWLPKDTRFNDGALVSVQVGRYQPNPWGLRDLHGNVAEWTRSEYRPYPYAEDDGRNRLEGDAPRVVRGGSWRDRPYRCTSSYRLAYRPYQPVFNVGFRVIVDDDRPNLALSGAAAEAGLSSK